MKKKFLMSFVFLAMFMFSVGLVAADNSLGEMVVRVDLKASSVGIQVPETILFEDIAAGYLSERQDLSIVNTGTVDMEITPMLSANYTGDIFTNLVFQRILSDPMTDVGIFDFSIEKPTIAGDTRAENIYMFLDLQEYAGDTSSNIDNHETEIVFWATAQ